MNELPRGHVVKAYVEIDPALGHCERICLFLDGAGWIEFTGVTLGDDGFILPNKLGCACTIVDISDRHWSLADYEIEFASSYSREGVFYAKRIRQVQSI